MVDHVLTTAVTCGERCFMCLLLDGIVSSCRAHILQHSPLFFVIGLWVCRHPRYLQHCCSEECVVVVRPQEGTSKIPQKYHRYHMPYAYTALSNFSRSVRNETIRDKCIRTYIRGISVRVSCARTYRNLHKVHTPRLDEKVTEGKTCCELTWRVKVFVVKKKKT